jgi:two-component system, chemotaxis family, protein-glutamate methylesterase/glutaminase
MCVGGAPGLHHKLSETRPHRIVSTYSAMQHAAQRQDGIRMAQRDIIVIGASAGGIAALTTLLSTLPPDFPAALFVVVHIPPSTVSRLPEILSRAGPLLAAHAQHGEAIAPGRIYVAPPDRHLLIRPGWVELIRGPRENHTRPAIDPLFRSAARAYGPRVIGIVLSGALYDGSMGLLAVKTRGGVALVQDPQDAAFESMPQSALRTVEADVVVPVAEMARVLMALVQDAVPDEGGLPMIDEDERMEAVVAADFAEQASDGRAEETTIYTCPDCGGVLWQDGAGSRLRFRCHVGHAYAPELLLSQKSEELEAALWSSLRLLKEKATLTRQLAARTRAGGDGGTRVRMADGIAEQAELDERYVRAIQDLLETTPSPLDQTAIVLQTLDDEAGHGVP